MIHSKIIRNKKKSEMLFFQFCKKSKYSKKNIKIEID